MVNLPKVIRESLRTGGLFYRKSWPWLAKLRTDGMRGTIHAVWPNGSDKRGWQPSAEDLIAEDWEITQK